MTYRELKKFAAETLKACHSDSYEYDVRCLCEHFLNVDRVTFDAMKDRSPDPEQEKDFIEAVRKRSEGCPLQYILGQWTFMDNEFYVGRGVLIPRDDTEVCVRECTEYLARKEKPRIIDLCSGSGAIAVTLAKMFPAAEVYALEMMPKAYQYLVKNIRHNKTENVKAVKGDIFRCYRNFENNYFDLIISNPPYVETDVIPTLQREVRFEPAAALNGGTDGLKFYRVIADKWLPTLKNNGAISLEIGETQADAVSKMLENRGIHGIRIVKDIQNLDRVVFGTKMRRKNIF